MKIAVLAPFALPIPPGKYGGIEQVVWDLVAGYTALGHDTVLVAPGTSQVPCKLIPLLPRHTTLDIPLDELQRLHEHLGPYAYDLALSEAPDIIHDHADYAHTPGLPVPVVRTMHGPAVPELVDRYLRTSSEGDALVAISHRQRELYLDAAQQRGRTINIVDVVHNPLSVDVIPFTAAKEDYVFFMGRASWEKGVDIAIRVAKAAGVHLKLALRITPLERPYFEECVEPLLDENVELLPELDAVQKYDYLGRARAVLFTSQWEEPFGLVMTEALACGTPVIAFPRGAAPEIIADGETGFLCDTEQGMAAALSRTETLSPASCRESIERQFNREHVAQCYVDILTRLKQHALRQPVWEDEVRQVLTALSQRELD